jgi:hypothetical protein
VIQTDLLPCGPYRMPLQLLRTNWTSSFYRLQINNILLYFYIWDDFWRSTYWCTFSIETFFLRRYLYFSPRWTLLPACTLFNCVPSRSNRIAAATLALLAYVQADGHGYAFQYSFSERRLRVAVSLPRGFEAASSGSKAWHRCSGAGAVARMFCSVARCLQRRQETKRTTPSASHSEKLNMVAHSWFILSLLLNGWKSEVAFEVGGTSKNY